MDYLRIALIGLMALPFGVTFPEAALGSAGVAGVVWLAKTLIGRVLDTRERRRINRRESIRQWHEEVQDLLTEISSTGVSVRTGRRSPVDEVAELKGTTVDLRKKVDPFPLWVRLRVNDNVRGVVLAAAGLAFHLTHMPLPDEEEESIANLMEHQYEILERIGSDTDVTVEKVLEIIGSWKEIDEGKLDVTADEAEEIFGAFESEVKTSLEDTETLTVDELKDLPWDIVDQVMTPATRREIVKHAVEQHYQIALIDKPREAKSALKDSMEELFG